MIQKTTLIYIHIILQTAISKNNRVSLITRLEISSDIPRFWQKHVALVRSLGSQNRAMKRTCVDNKDKIITQPNSAMGITRPVKGKKNIKLAKIAFN